MINKKLSLKHSRASRHIKHLKSKEKFDTVSRLKKNKKHQRVRLKKRHHLVYGLISVLVITLFYLYVDRDASFFFHRVRHTEFFDIFFWMQYLSNMLEYAVPLVYIYLIVMLFFKRFFYLEEFLFASANSLLVAVSIKNFLKHIFGRYWTETFTNNNPSLIQSHKYGFNFFHDGAAYNSFPSGHSAVIFSVATVIWIMYPRLRLLAVLMCASVIIGLLGCDFHFPSDIIAGAFIGVLSAYFVMHASQEFAKNIREHEKEKIEKIIDKI